VIDGVFPLSKLIALFSCTRLQIPRYNIQQNKTQNSTQTQTQIKQLNSNSSTQLTNKQTKGGKADYFERMTSPASALSDADTLVLVRHAPPPPTDLINSLVVADGSSNVLLLTAWLSNGLGVEVSRSLTEGRTAATFELASRTTKGRVTSAAGYRDDATRTSYLALTTGSGRQIQVEVDIDEDLDGKGNEAAEGDRQGRSGFEVCLRYEARTVAIGRRKADGQLILATGGPRGVVLQTLSTKTQVLACIWRRYPVRVVQFSRDGEYLLICSATGDIGLFRADMDLRDDLSPMWATRIPSAAICSASFSLPDPSSTTRYFSVSAWSSDPKPGEEEASRPLHYVYRVIANPSDTKQTRVVPHPELGFLQKEAKTRRTTALLPPPALSAFSLCGRFFATTSSCSSVTVWDITTGQKVRKWGLSVPSSPFPEPGEEICGLATVETRDTGDIKSVLLVRTAGGVLAAVRWPCSSGWIPHSPFERPGGKQAQLKGESLRAVEALIANDFFEFQVVFVEEDPVTTLAVFCPRKDGRGAVTLLANAVDGKVVSRFESRQLLGRDRVLDGKKSSIWAQLRIKLVQSVRMGGETGEVVLRFAGLEDRAIASEFIPEKDVWRYV